MQLHAVVKPPRGATGFAPAVVGPFRVEAGVRDFEFELHPWAVLPVRVVDAQRRPMTMVHVRADFADSDLLHSMLLRDWLPLPASTGPGGLLRLRLPAGVLQITAYGRRLPGPVQRTVTVAPGDNPELARAGAVTAGLAFPVFPAAQSRPLDERHLWVLGLRSGAGAGAAPHCRERALGRRASGGTRSYLSRLLAGLSPVP
jgi:hypothetical protein